MVSLNAKLTIIDNPSQAFLTFEVPDNLSPSEKETARNYLGVLRGFCLPEATATISPPQNPEKNGYVFTIDPR